MDQEIPPPPPDYADQTDQPSQLSQNPATQEEVKHPAYRSSVLKSLLLLFGVALLLIMGLSGYFMGLKLTAIPISNTAKNTAKATITTAPTPKISGSNAGIIYPAPLPVLPSPTKKIYGGDGFSFTYNEGLNLWVDPEQKSVWDGEYKNIPRQQLLMVQSSSTPFPSILSNDTVPLISTSSAVIVQDHRTRIVDNKYIEIYYVTCGTNCADGIARFQQGDKYFEIIMDTQDGSTHFDNTVNSLLFLPENQPTSNWTVYRDENIIFALPSGIGPDIQQPNYDRWLDNTPNATVAAITLYIQNKPFNNPVEHAVAGNNPTISNSRTIIQDGITLTRYDQNCCSDTIVLFSVNNQYYQLIFDKRDFIYPQLGLILSTIRILPTSQIILPIPPSPTPSPTPPPA